MKRHEALLVIAAMVTFLLSSAWMLTRTQQPTTITTFEAYQR